jgi:hypothetical protein
MRRGVIFFLSVVVIFSWSCENPETLLASKAFNGNNLQTAYIDTFTVVASTVQLDTVLTNNSGTLLLGKYLDDRLGTISSSSYIQLSYTSNFLPPSGPQFVFDSIALILPYSHYYIGDTTKPAKINIYQLNQPMLVRKLPVTSEQKLSVFANGNGFFNSSQFTQFPNPIASATVNFLPHNDSLYIPLPDAFGANWFRLAQIDSAHLFANSSAFVGSYFYGLHIDVDPSTLACVVGFKTNKVKIRLYYSQASGTDVPVSSHVDFILYNFQFNNIQADRTGTPIANIQPYKPVPSSLTGDATYVQTGTGLVTLLQFPSLKSFFSTRTGVILNAAYLQIYPLQGTYPKYFPPPSPLQLYFTDNSYIPLTAIAGGAAGIQYDYEYGINTLYNYQIFSFVFAQIKANTNYFPNLILAPTGNQGSSVSRVYVGDQFHPLNKIKLLIYYSYVVP